MKKAFVLFLTVILSSLTIASLAADTKALAREAHAKFRAIDNSSAAAAGKALLEEAKALMDQIAAADPKSAELMMLNSKYKRAASRFRTVEPVVTAAPVDPAAASADAAAKNAAADEASAGRAQVIREWETFIASGKPFIEKVDDTFPLNGNVLYEPDNVEPVFALIEDVKKNDIPRLTQELKDFSAKYGATADDIDRKLFDLTPLDSRYGRYDERNKRPDDSAGHLYAKVAERIPVILDAPKAEAKRILKQTMDRYLSNMSFYLDTERDAKYAEAEKSLQVALRFNPEDEEVKTVLARTQAERKQSVGDIEKALDSATFPASIGNFAGPGTTKELIAATLDYFNQSYPNEKAIAASIAGNWISAKTDLLGQTIQWGLPVFVASLQGGSTDIARVFKMTVLTVKGSGVQKSLPFEDHWTGDSYRMRAKTVLKN